MAEQNRLLIVDDDDVVRSAVCDYMTAQGFAVEEARDIREGLERFETNPPDVAIVDYSLPDGNALELMERLREEQVDVPVVVLTGRGTIDLAVRAIKEGAEQFLTKPVELASMLVIVKRAVENKRNHRKSLIGKTQRERQVVDPFLGANRAISELETMAHKVIRSESPILIIGETGTGKGVLANWLHSNGARANEAFVDLNCAGLTREFLETELFGHERGAFTGAHAAKVGLLELAHRGTIFLDEIGDTDIQVQAKLLKSIEEKRFRRLGAVKDRKVDIRLIAATHHDLKQRIRDGEFRSDFYFRISTLPLAIPPLRERAEDIGAIAEHLLSELVRTAGRSPVTLKPDALETLEQYPWPGNIRELRSVLERAVLLSEHHALGRHDLHFDTSSIATAAETVKLHDLEIHHIESVLREEGWHVGRTAKKLGIPRSSLYDRIKKHGIIRDPHFAVV